MSGRPAVRATVRIPLRFSDGYQAVAQVFTFTGLTDAAEHVALGFGDFRRAAVPLVRLHSECLTGDVFGSTRCDCGPQLREAVERVTTAGGYVLYLRQEGRGIGLYNKLDAYVLQDRGLDTFEANEALGLPADSRDYRAAAQMLKLLDATAVDLLSNNPDKAEQLGRAGIAVRDRVGTGVYLTDSNRGYLRTKAAIGGHRLDLGAAEPVHSVE